MYKLGINFDEISPDLTTAITVMRGLGIARGELRTLGHKNFVFWSDEEVTRFKQAMTDAEISVVAAATPLFKWYARPSDQEIKHDSFGFNPRLEESEKKQMIARTIEIATALEIPRLRIFSGLGRDEAAGEHFAADPLLASALALADRYGIDLYVENEPVCVVHSQKELLNLFNHQKHPRLKLWLDIANLMEVGDKVDDAFLAQVSDRLGYVHIKDFTLVDDRPSYVPVGRGIIPYGEILQRIHSLAVKDLVFTVETHAKTNRVEASVHSVLATQKLLNGLQ